ncbi:MAG: tryptophan synthase subunit beta [Candidatus Firestonebacteria bacterium RIFOXYC2_FULL_39_67]|nr:MAG: tryptophan synthase subunit beta [Candidatus Firestonebacteria bacterium RIFOXYD2_FULL_39_29]OGF53554.1 MAG: tryptophan synthase subunit beta [Candidatus Firestonebacteria bacterium RIFOXYC2_FULL_39_67]OGF54357.1 MAG: tryptophan synthase subunit beta [Candidatus Firestonebacteria bacterium RifOxyC12_full_39_7]
MMPDKNGYFGKYGGTFVPETLMPALEELKKEFFKAIKDKNFKAELKRFLSEFAGRPTELYYAEKLTEYMRGPKIYLKREDMTHTGSHKINNCIGQALMALRMDKKRIIAETGAGQHGVATATVAARFGLKCDVFMGSEDCKRQALNVYRMKLLGTNVIPVESGTKTLKDALNEAMRNWVSNVDNTYYMLGTVAGPHPYPLMVRYFQKVIGEEARRQIIVKEGRLPNYIIACVGGGSNAIGIFHPFFNDKKVRFIGVEAGGRSMKPTMNSASISAGTPGSLHGSYTYLLQDKDGQVLNTHSIAAGLDYPAVGPEHSYYKDIGRAEYSPIMDKDALKAYDLLSKIEGIIPALESSHAVAYVIKHIKRFKKTDLLIINLSGRGDKDVGRLL